MPFNEHLTDEMKRAIRESDSERAEELQKLSELTETGETGAVNFIKASKGAQEMYGVENCLVFHYLPPNVTNREQFYDFCNFLIREARRQHALFLNHHENQDYILVQFPGRPEEIYSLRAFEGSLRNLHGIKIDL